MKMGHDVHERHGSKEVLDASSDSEPGGKGFEVNHREGMPTNANAGARQRKTREGFILPALRLPKLQRGGAQPCSTRVKSPMPPPACLQHALEFG